MIIEIPDYCINELVVNGLKKTVAEAKCSHMTDIVNRCEGRDRRHEADWVKYILIREDWKAGAELPPKMTAMEAQLQREAGEGMAKLAESASFGRLTVRERGKDMELDRRSLYLFKPAIAAWSLREKLRRPFAGLRFFYRDSGGGLILCSRHWPHLLCWSWIIRWQTDSGISHRPWWRVGRVPHNKIFDIGPVKVVWQGYQWMPATGPTWEKRCKAFVERRTSALCS